MRFAGIYRICRIAGEHLLDDISVFIMFQECLENPIGEVGGKVDELVLLGGEVATLSITSRSNPAWRNDVEEEFRDVLVLATGGEQSDDFFGLFKGNSASLIRSNGIEFDVVFGGSVLVKGWSAGSVEP